jgi:hypothetical protein
VLFSIVIATAAPVVGGPCTPGTVLEYNILYILYHEGFCTLGADAYSGVKVDR